MFMTRQTAGPPADVRQGGDIGDDTYINPVTCKILNNFKHETKD